MMYVCEEQLESKAIRALLVSHLFQPRQRTMLDQTRGPAQEDGILPLFLVRCEDVLFHHTAIQMANRVFPMSLLRRFAQRVPDLELVPVRLFELAHLVVE